MQSVQKEFKPSSNFLRHVAKEHLKISLFQCPGCEGYSGQDAYEVRAHIQMMHPDQNLEPVNNLEANADQIEKVYQQCFPGRKLKTICTEKSKVSTPVPLPAAVLEQKPVDECRVQCKECDMDMKTEDRQIHVYRHHLKEPQLYQCPACDFSHHACSSDVKAHIRFSHRETPDLTPRANLLKFSKEISEWNDRCFPGWVNRRLPATCLEDFNRCRSVMWKSGRPQDILLRSICKSPCTNALCEIKSLEPIANVVKRRASFSELHDQCFPGRPKRLTNITISDEGRRTKCKLCGMTISKKRRGHHLLEKHLRKDVYKCKLCQFSSNSDKSGVETHITEMHPGCKGKAAEVCSELIKYLPQLKELAKTCFNDISHQKTEETYVEQDQTSCQEIVKRITDDYYPLCASGCSSMMANRASSWSRTADSSPLPYRMLAFAITRYKLNFESPQTGLDSLLDFTKAEDYANTNQEGTAIVAIKLGQAIFIPAILQFLASVVGLFPLYMRPPKFYMMLHLLFSSFSIVLWIEPIFLAALELNLRNVQLNTFYQGVNFRVLLAVIMLFSADVLLVGSFLAVYSAAQLSSNSRTNNSVVDIHINMCTLLISLACFALSCYATYNSMTKVTYWPTSSRNLAALYGVGLRELIVSSYVLCAAIYGSCATILRLKSLRLGAIVTQSISLFCIFIYLLNADRITATTHNVQLMLKSSISTPFSGEILMILYFFVVLLAIVLLVQLTSTTINVFQFLQ
uniref:C2H2-type domain-containing protein n=1 Tax=Ditylenchus dipsaci TaxID=166011 RepID=A0A915D967_9BILA